MKKLLALVLVVTGCGGTATPTLPADAGSQGPAPAFVTLPKAPATPLIKLTPPPTVTAGATPEPTSAPTAKPTHKPTAKPTAKPTPRPTHRPTPKPTHANCDPSYPTVCIPPPPPDLDCKDIPFRRFKVVGADPHRFDGDHNGIGCES